MSVTVDVHSRWDTTGFALTPVAPATGPFVRRDLLAAWWRHRGGDGELLLVESPTALIPLCRWNGAIRFLGEADLTDYHSPLGTGSPELLAGFVATLPPGTPLRFDSLPAEAAAAVIEGLTLAGIPATRVEHEVAAVMELPETFDAWLGALGRKERHEVRRKLRRFDAAGGSAALRRAAGTGAVTAFCELHRMAGGDKGMFMTPEMEAFFGALHDGADAVIDLLDGPSGAPAAASFGFEDEEAFYLYNSAYDPAAGALSPGIVLLAALVRRAIRSGLRRFDFLKGDEPYKFRHGAQRRPLYEIRAETGARR